MGFRILTMPVAALALFLASCGGGGGGDSFGLTAVLLKDGPIQASDGRTIIRLEIDITRAVLEREEEDAADGDDDEVQVFDTSLGDHEGNPLTVDLLTLETTAALLGLFDVPTGVYEEAELTVTAARAEFRDEPGVLVPLEVSSSGSGPAERFEFEFEPPVTVSTGDITVAQVDFVPVVVLKDGRYVLFRNPDNDETGEIEDDAPMQIEVEGTITGVSPDGNSITVSGIASPIDVTNAEVEENEQPSSKAALAVGQTVEVHGVFSPVTGVIVADEVEIE